MDSASDSSHRKKTEPGFYRGLGIHPVFRELQNDHQGSGIEVVNVKYKRQAHAAQSRSGFDDKQSIWHDTVDKNLVGRLESGRNPKTREARRRLILIILGLFLALGIILAIAVGITLRLHSPDGGSEGSTDAANSSTPNSPHSPAGKSTSGALNGTGFAVLGPSDPSQGIRLLYQHHTGEIRSLGLQDDVWQKENPVVRINIKKGTQLTAASYYSDGARASHLFYVDSSNILQEVTSVDNGTTWQMGLLGEGKFGVANHSKTALTACYMEDVSSKDEERPVTGAGLKLWYGAEDDSVQELSWTIGDRWWRTTFVFSNLYAGNPLTSSCEDAGNAYLWITTDDNDGLALWWKDFGGGSNNNNGAGDGNWTQGLFPL
ncbi:MAG: hypothetical protein Q9214_006916 [Letrouitia sp. 1 TL-2023]